MPSSKDKARTGKQQLSSEQIRLKKMEEALRNNLRRRKTFTRAQTETSPQGKDL